MQPVRSNCINSTESADFILQHIRFHNSGFCSTQMCTWEKLGCVFGCYAITKFCWSYIPAECSRTQPEIQPECAVCLFTVSSLLTITTCEAGNYLNLEAVRICNNKPDWYKQDLEKRYFELHLFHEKTVPSASILIPVIKYEWWAPAQHHQPVV